MQKKNEYIGKFMVVNEHTEGERIFVIGDLHLGYEASLRDAGILVVEHLFDELKEELENAIEKAEINGKITQFVMLGDIKHAFGSISKFEREQLLKLVGIMKEKSNKIVAIKGNHDVLLDYMKNENIEIKEYYICGRTALIHGDRDFEEIWGIGTNQIIMGHLHPAVAIEDGVKREKYKCFLIGKLRGKDLIIAPSATGSNSGTDIMKYGYDLPWKVDLGRFEVIVASDDGKNYEFGKLKDI